MEIALLPLIFYILSIRIKNLDEAIKRKHNVGYEAVLLFMIILLALGLLFYIRYIIK